MSSDSGYIDLSKKKVHKQEEIEFMDKFAKAKTIYSIMRTLAEDRHTDIESMFKLVAWPLYKESPQPLQILIQAMNDESRLDSLNLDEPTKTKLMSEIRRRFQPKCVKIMSTFEISINDFEGINILKEALSLGKKKSRPEFNIDVNTSLIQITILGAPVYLLSLETDKEVEGMHLIKEALDEMKNFIESKNGAFKIKDAVRITTLLSQKSSETRTLTWSCTNKPTNRLKMAIIVIHQVWEMQAIMIDLMCASRTYEMYNLNIMESTSNPVKKVKVKTLSNQVYELEFDFSVGFG